MDEITGLFAYLAELDEKYYSKGRKPGLMEAEAIWEGVMSRYKAIMRVSAEAAVRKARAAEQGAQAADNAPATEQESGH